MFHNFEHISYQGTRGFAYEYNGPIIVKYVIKDEHLLRELNIKSFDQKSESLIQPVSQEQFEEYMKVLRLRESKIVDVRIKAKVRELMNEIEQLLLNSLGVDGSDENIISEQPII